MARRLCRSGGAPFNDATSGGRRNARGLQYRTHPWRAFCSDAERGRDTRSANTSGAKPGNRGANARSGATWMRLGDYSAGKLHSKVGQRGRRSRMLLGWQITATSETERSGGAFGYQPRTSKPLIERNGFGRIDRGQRPMDSNSANDHPSLRALLLTRRGLLGPQRASFVHPKQSYRRGC